MSRKVSFAVGFMIFIFLAGCVYSNHPPVFNDIGPKEISIDQLLSFQIGVSDPDGDLLYLSISPKEYSQFFDPSSSEFSWTPSYEDLGEHQLSFLASDGEETVYKDVTITVKQDNEVTNPTPPEENNPPELSPIENQSVIAYNVLSFEVNAQDVDHDSLQYELISTDGLDNYFDNVTGQFYWATTEDDVGNYQLRVQVTDGLVTVAEDFNIRVETSVLEVNDVADIQLDEGKTLGPIPLTVNNYPGNELTWEIISGPGEIVSSSYYQWITNYSDSGEHMVTIQATDNRGRRGVVGFSIQVANVNRSPELQIIHDGGLVDGVVPFPINQEIKLSIEAIDLDSDSLNYEIANWYTHDGNQEVSLESHFSVDQKSEKGVFSWMPLSGDEGTYTITFKVSDENGASDLKSIALNVN